MTMNHENLHHFTTEEPLTEEMSMQEQQAYYHQFVMRCHQERYPMTVQHSRKGAFRRTLIGVACAAAFCAIAMLTVSASGLRSEELVVSVFTDNTHVEAAVLHTKPTVLHWLRGATPAVSNPHQIAESDDTAYTLTLEEYVLDGSGSCYLAVGITYSDGSLVPEEEAAECAINFDPVSTDYASGSIQHLYEDGYLTAVQMSVHIEEKTIPDTITLRVNEALYTFNDLTVTQPGYWYWEEYDVRLSALSMILEKDTPFHKTVHAVVFDNTWPEAKSVITLTYTDGTAYPLYFNSYGGYSPDDAPDPSYVCVTYNPYDTYADWQSNGSWANGYCIDLERFDSITVGDMTLSREDAVWCME